ncbi:MAG: hypothetical protein EXR98_23050 [Gemmataceae bacterium]|nr:hypothetical protein [Gemmataceae bacterium]
MASVTIPDEAFEPLAKRAAALNVTVEQLVLKLVTETDGNGRPTPAPPQPFNEWKKNFDAWMADVQARANRYPPDFAMDDSRESIYEGCGQ